MMLPSRVFRGAEWLTPNETEAASYESAKPDSSLTTADTAARSLLDPGCRGVVLKMGSKGVCLATPSREPEFVSAFPVTAVDSTAGGDAFNGGFAVGLMEGKSPRQSAIFASAVAALSVMWRGAPFDAIPG
jgi:ribokinase